jgi:hypothetical protein
MPRGKSKAETELPNTSADEVAECYVQYTEYMGEIARIRQKIGTMLARYHAIGVHTKAIRACYRLANMDDAPDYVKELLKAAAILKIIPAAEESDGQMTFLPGLKVSPASAESQSKLNRSKVFWDGYDAGLAGHLIEACNHAAGSEDFVTWRDGWEDGKRDFDAKPKKEKKAKRVNDRAAEKPPETALEQDESSYRAQGTKMLAEPAP